MKKGKNILAVGVAGALLLSITGSVQPLNQAKALSAPQASATNSLDVKNLHDGIYSIDAIIIDAPWLLSNMIDIDKTRLIVKDGQYKVELNTKCFEDVFFVSHIWNLKYLDSGAEKDAQITGWHDTNSPGYEVNTEASRAVEYFRNYPDRYAFPKTIVYPVDKSKIDSTNELDTYIICDCGTYKTQRCIYREKLVLKFATLKPIELDYSKEKVTAKEKIRDLSFLNGEEFNDFNRKIDQAKDEKEIQNLVDQAITQDNANKEAKTKALAEIGKLANLNEEEKAEFKEKINKTDSAAVANEVLKQAIAKDNANKEAKTKALEELDKLANLDEKERESFKEKINKTDSVAVANEVLNQAKEKNTANKELKEAKAKALEELGKLANLDEKEKDNLKEEINQAQDKKEINRVLDRAKEKEKAREEIEELANAKENAKAEINKLANLTEEQKEAAKKEIDNTDSKEGVNDALARAKEKDKAALAKVKAKVKEEIEKLANLTKDQKEAAEAKIDKASSIEEVDETRTKVKAKAAIEKFTNLTKEQKDNLKEEIDKADSLEQVKDVFVKAKEKDKANKEAKEAKTKALEELGKLDNLDEKEKDYLKEEINLAQDKKEINRVLDRAKEKNTANKELKDAKEKAVKEVTELKNLTEAEKTKAALEINKANSVAEVNTALDKAKELDKKHGAENPSVNPNPAPDVTPTPTPEIKAGWKNNEIGWWYQRANGTYPVSEWEIINGTWYHFDENGYMQTGWLNSDGTWYYLNADGSMATDTWIDGYYVDANGAWVVEGWQNNGYGWWYQRANGTYPHSEWEMINGIWYYFDSNGYMLADEATPDSYYVDANGAWVK